MHSKLFAMTTPAGRLRRTIAGLAALGVLLGAPAARAAFLPLPANGSQVNNDLANAIDPNQDAGVSDVAGGAVTAGKLEVRGATFEQKVADGEQQIFVRAFKNGAWVTQGFPASLNIDPTDEAEAPSIVSAGAGRTVPWVAWYEPSAAAGWPTNIFASRFNAAANRWLPSGQGRGPLHLPSLNIHTVRTAEHPSVAGGSAVAGNDPVPWVTSEENDGVPNDGTTLRQIFVAKAVKQAVPGTACPVGTKPVGGNDVNGFCWQQVGLDRLNPSGPLPSDSGDPSTSTRPARASSRTSRSPVRTTPSRGSSGTRRIPARSTGSAATTWSSRRGSSPTPRPTGASVGWPSGTGRPDRPTSSTPRARTASATAPRPRPRRTRARSTRRAAGTRRTRASPPARSLRAARPCRGSSGRRISGSICTPSSSHTWSAATTSSSSTGAGRSRTRRTTRRDPTSRSPATCRTSPGRRKCRRRR